jgi:hypothetical protein
MHSVFGDFLNGKKLVHVSDVHLSFNCPLPTGQLNNIGCYKSVATQEFFQKGVMPRIFFGGFNKFS